MKITNRNHGKYCALELHVHKNVINQGDLAGIENYRVFIHTGLTKELLLKNEESRNIEVGNKEIYKLQTIEEAESLYDNLRERYLKNRYQTYQLISPRIGSNLLQKTEKNISSMILQPPIQELVSYVRNQTKILIIFINFLTTKIYSTAEERTNSLLCDLSKDALNSPLGQLSLQEIDKAESILQKLIEATE